MRNHNYLIIKYFSQILSYFREPGFDRFCTKKSRLHCELQKIAEIDLAFSKMSLRNEKENVPKYTKYYENVFLGREKVL